jgi:NTE family protein
MFPRHPFLVPVLAGLLLAGCATRPVNPPIAQVAAGEGYRFQSRQALDRDPSTLLVVAFSGGGTRAAAFAFGVLETLRDTPVPGPDGTRRRLLDDVDILTGVSGGSFTALGFGLHGDRLFEIFPTRFLERDIQGDLFVRTALPGNWAALASSGYGRSEIAAQLYDEVLFEGATFGDLMRRPGPLVIASATDISTGSRLGFIQTDFDLICSDVAAVPLSRAAAASSAVPLVLSPVTLNNYGGRCGFREPAWVAAMADPANRVRPAGRALQRLREMREFQQSDERPYVHLVDGGISDNLGLRAVLEALEQFELARAAGRTTRLDSIRRIAFIIVNSLSQPKTDWDRHENPPNDLEILLRATGVPIDRYSYEAIEVLREMVARWNAARPAAGAARAAGSPDGEIFGVDVSFAGHPDTEERAFLNEQPTSFVLSKEAVTRLRQGARTILESSPEFRRLLDDLATRSGAR